MENITLNKEYLVRIGDTFSSKYKDKTSYHSFQCKLYIYILI